MPGVHKFIQPTLDGPITFFAKPVARSADDCVSHHMKKYILTFVSLFMGASLSFADLVCNMITIDDLKGKDYPRFEAFSTPVISLKPARVDLESHPLAKRYRTRLREGAAEGPNFAGHFTIVGWGCGT